MTPEGRPGSPPSATTKTTSPTLSMALSSNSGYSSAARATWDLTSSLGSSKRRYRLNKAVMRTEATMTSTTGTPVHRAVVDGQPLAGDELFEVLDPATGSPCALVARCGPREVDAAVQSAR